ncbi:MAG: HAD family hydrolase [Spirochaetaceae bacterium]|jgi:putative hydrolase of the HAD superfamily|nr:HAD family hydrolase [Spirochaetaceae bacterium]
MPNVLDAVAFDIDGTLYPNYRFYLRLCPFVLRHGRLLAAFGQARKLIRKQNGSSPDTGAVDFYALQSSVMARILGKKPEETRLMTQKLIYEYWEGLFKKVKLFPGVLETVRALRAAGIKTAVLSDFPLGRKLENLTINGLWDVELCSEELGMLKPGSVSFLELQRRLDVPAERILFVGNSLVCDIAGAKRCGMKTALISARPRRFPPAAAPDFVFKAYRQLREYVLG